MSTDQTLPGPASSRLAGPAGIVEPVAGLDGTEVASLSEQEQRALSNGQAQPTVAVEQAMTPQWAAAVEVEQPVATAEPSIPPVELAPESAGTAPQSAGTAQQSAGTAQQAAGTAQQSDGTAQQAAGTAPEPAGTAQQARQPAVSSRQAEASGHLVAMSFPGARRVAGWLFWVVFPLLCIAAIQTSVTNAVHHLGNKPVGIRGTFVVQPRSCSQGFCSFGGLFTSDDHTIKNLPLLGDPRWHTTEVHRVIYDPRSVEVTALPGHWDPTPSVMATFGALTYLVVIGYFLRERRRRPGRFRQLATNA